jgi:hypothetical protein
MALVGNLLKVAVTVAAKRRASKKVRPVKGQLRVLSYLLKHAQDTAFGKHHDFASILESLHPIREFRNRVPIVNYDGMHQWWKRCEEGEHDVTWPGKVKYFALSSGTSGAPSKNIPVTAAQIKAMQKVSRRMLLVLDKLNLPSSTYECKMLSLGGSTQLLFTGQHYKGDLSGINGKKVPRWFRWYYKPGKKITRERDWEHRLEMMVEQAPEWNIGVMAGSPSWSQILMQRIIQEHGAKTIHDIWPNLAIFVHGGVSVEPYREALNKLFGKPMVLLDTYLASEGFIAIQTSPEKRGMELVTDVGIYYEFVPFIDENFDELGKLRDPHALALDITQVRTDEPYALVMSTPAGAWRYLIGDVVRFVSLDPLEIVIVGRTAHYLSICGEHVSVENMMDSLRHAAQQMGQTFLEFSLVGYRDGDRFAHRWYIGGDSNVDEKRLAELLDEELKRLNDDYAVERAHAIHKVTVHVLPNEWFNEFLSHIGRVGAQTKFPRVLRGDNLAKWEEFIAQKGFVIPDQVN